jgi:SAM-dependent methyltransferase
MRWLPRRVPPYETAVAMIGVKSGDRLLVAGAGAEPLAAALAVVTGLNGLALVANDAPDAETKTQRAANDAGALVECLAAPAHALPVDPGAFDLVVLHNMLGGADPQPLSAVVREARRVLRPGGRLMLVEGTPQAAWRRALTPRRAVDGDAAMALLVDAGFKAARVLAATGGVSYLEAIRGAE